MTTVPAFEDSHRTPTDTKAVVCGKVSRMPALLDWPARYSRVNQLINTVEKARSAEANPNGKRQTGRVSWLMRLLCLKIRDRTRKKRVETSVHRELVGSTLTLFHTRGSPVKQCEYLEFSPNYSASANN